MTEDRWHISILRRCAQVLYQASGVVLYAIVFGATCSLIISCSTWLDMRIHSAYCYWIGMAIALIRTRRSRWAIDIVFGQIISLLIMMTTHQWMRLPYDIREAFLIDAPLQSYISIFIGGLILIQLYLVGYYAYALRCHDQREENDERAHYPAG